ncbi:MAG: hypothetical protein QOJ17_6317 [Rhodospirillaceae bacterium]|jgi:hypothetical protein|nr:hypothetical protein [Rhodospirillaceae bacterium]
MIMDLGDGRDPRARILRLSAMEYRKGFRCVCPSNLGVCDGARVQFNLSKRAVLPKKKEPTFSEAAGTGFQFHLPPLSN